MENGDFLKIDYIGKVAETGEIFDLTNEEEAKKAGIFNEKRKYEPALVIIGANMIVPGVEDELQKMKVGEEKEFDVDSSKAFGPRSPKLMKIVSTGKFIEKNINPTPGLFVDIDGMQARIKSVSGGRTMVDFNHPLAGRRLHYKVRIVSEIKEPLEKARAVLEHYKIDAEPSLNEGILNLHSDKELPKPISQLLEATFKEWIKEAKEIKFSHKAKSTAVENNTKP